MSVLYGMPHLAQSHQVMGQENSMTRDSVPPKFLMRRPRDGPQKEGGMYLQLRRTKDSIQESKPAVEVDFAEVDLLTIRKCVPHRKQANWSRPNRPVIFAHVFDKIQALVHEPASNSNAGEVVRSKLGTIQGPLILRCTVATGALGIRRNIMEIMLEDKHIPSGRPLLLVLSRKDTWSSRDGMISPVTSSSGSIKAGYTGQFLG
ncbi:hypothetical protein B0H14DRAFT_3171191 [Mycena olivaceomarginata]|nr:hypothetical protein B0H14DRAFT_3171191 [Mycena olivaceomarginata]